MEEPNLFYGNTGRVEYRQPYEVANNLEDIDK